MVAVADTIKEDAAAAVAGLKEKGIAVWMVTGDNWRTANAVAAQVGITDVMAQVCFLLFAFCFLHLNGSAPASNSPLPPLIHRSCH
jgi:magnesium-transporting ATPase (P-type)